MNAQQLMTSDLGVPWILYIEEDGAIVVVSIYLELLEKKCFVVMSITFSLFQQTV